MHLQCSPTGVGLTQACPSKEILNSGTTDGGETLLHGQHLMVF